MIKVETAGTTVAGDLLQIVNDNGRYSVQLNIDNSVIVFNTFGEHAASELMNSLMSKGISSISVYP